MKKKGFQKIKTILLSGAVWTLASMTVFAGDINGNEQAVLDAAEGTFESGGKQYVATDAAKDRIRSYLSQDGVDLTAEQASKAISQAFGNIEMGIAQGYLVLAPGQEEPALPEEIPEEEELPEDPEEDSQSADTETKESSQEGQPDASGAPGNDGNVQGSESAGADSPEKMTKEEEDALISSVLEKEGLEAEEAQKEPKEKEQKESEKVDKLPGSVNVTAVAAAIVAVVLAAMGILLYKHKNRFKNK